MQVYKITQPDNVTYHVTGNNQEEAIRHLEECEMQWNGYLETEPDTWIVKEVTEPFKIHFADENIDFMSTDLITNMPDVLCCSEW